MSLKFFSSFKICLRRQSKGSLDRTKDNVCPSHSDCQEGAAQGAEEHSLLLLLGFKSLRVL